MALTIELPPELEAKLAEAASKRGIEAGDYVRPVLARDAETGPPPSPSDIEGFELLSAPVTHVFAEIPEPECDRIPQDLASQADRYVYGLPKREA